MIPRAWFSGHETWQQTPKRFPWCWMLTFALPNKSTLTYFKETPVKKSPGWKIHRSLTAGIGNSNSGIYRQVEVGGCWQGHHIWDVGDLNSAVWTLKSPFKRAVTVIEEFVVLIWWTTCTPCNKDLRVCTVYIYIHIHTPFGINIRDLHCFLSSSFKIWAAAFSWYAPKQQYVLQCILL